MLEVIFYIVWISNAILLCINKRSKLLSVISFVLTIIIFGGSTSNGDYAIYLRHYEYRGLGSYSFEPGYNLLVSLAKQIGLNYNQFLIVIAILSYLLIVFVYSKLSKNYQAFYTIYFSIFLFYDINQVRNFLVVSLMFLFFYYVKEQKKIPAIVTIIIATTLQYIAIVYLPLCFFDYEKKYTSKFLRACAYAIVGFCVIIFLNGNKIPIVQGYLERFLFGIDASKSAYYSKSVRLGFLLSFLLQFMNLFLILLSKRKLIHSGKYQKRKKEIDVLLAFNIYGFVAFPFVMVNHNFYRIFRNFCALDTMAVGITLEAEERNDYSITSKQLLYVLFLIAYVLIWRYGMMFKYRDFSQIDEILRNNLFFMGR